MQKAVRFQIYTKPQGTRHSLRKESRPNLHSWSRFGEGLSKRWKARSYKTWTRMKVLLHFTVSSTLKDNSCNFFVQLDQKDFSKCCEENKDNSFITNAPSAPTTFACLSEDLGREKKRLKEKALKLINFRISNRKMTNLKAIIFMVMNCLVIKYTIIT